MSKKLVLVWDAVRYVSELIIDLSHGVHPAKYIGPFRMHPLVAAHDQLRMREEVAAVISDGIFGDWVYVTEFLSLRWRAALLAADSYIPILVNIT